MTFTSPASARPPVRPRSVSSHVILALTLRADRLITSKDHASVQISIADVDANGRALNTSTTFALSGPVRAMGESDDSINRLAQKAGRAFHFVTMAALIFIDLAPQSSGTSGSTPSKRRFPSSFVCLWVHRPSQYTYVSLANTGVVACEASVLLATRRP